MGFEAIYKRLFEAALDGILILDGETGQIVDANPSLVELLKCPRSELLGKALWETGLLESADGARRIFCELLDKQHVRYENLFLLTKGGQRVAVALSGHVHQVDGRAIVECCIRAMSRRGDADEVGRESRQTQRMGAVGKLAGGVAHDLNNLVGGILGYCEILEGQKSLPDTAQRMIAEIHNTGTSAKNLAQMLLAFSSGQDLQSVVLDLNETVSRMERLLEPLIGEKIQLTSLPGRSLGSIRANPNQIDQVLLNLVINARDAMPKGGNIVIATANTEVDEGNSPQSPTKPGRYVMLTVSDTGSGMDQKTQARIFEPFFSTKPLGKGTGLGLPTVSGIVEQCGGMIAVYSELGVGSTFKILFPRLREAPDPRMREEAGPVRGGTETILLVDDSVPLRKLMRRFLTGAGYTVLDSGDPAEALHKAAENQGPIPLIVTDMVLPGFSGGALAERVIAARPGTKVLYVSGSKQDLNIPSRVLGQDYAFLAKPFTQEELLGAIRRLLDAPVKQTF
jgi:PAS domain S-box-containing protein